MPTYPDKTSVINDIQRSKTLRLSENVEFVCAAVLEYYKKLNEAAAIKTPPPTEKKKEAPKAEKPLNQMNKGELLARADEIGIGFEADAKKKDIIKAIEAKLKEPK